MINYNNKIADIINEFRKDKGILGIKIELEFFDGNLISQSLIKPLYKSEVKK